MLTQIVFLLRAALEEKLAWEVDNSEPETMHTFWLQTYPERV